MAISHPVSSIFGRKPSAANQNNISEGGIFFQKNSTKLSLSAEGADEHIDLINDDQPAR